MCVRKPIKGETYISLVRRLGNGLRLQAQTFASLGDFVGSEGQHSREELTLGQRVSVLWRCFGFCFPFIVVLARLSDCYLRDSDSAR